VLPDDFDPTSLSSAWSVVHGGDASVLEGELARELSLQHVLHGRTATAVAVHERRKESIFWLPVSRLWAIVHLTWSEETDPRWPSAELCDCWASVVEGLLVRGRG
jgi:hypothetical protein